MHKKILAWLIVLALSLSILPSVASAVPDTDNEYSEFLGQNIYASDQMSMSDDGTRVMLASSYWGWIGVFSLSNKSSDIWHLDREADAVIPYFHAKMSGDGKVVVAVDTFGLVRYFKIDSGPAPVWSYNTSMALTSIAISYDGGRVIVSGMGGAAYFDANGHQGTISDPGINYLCSVSNDGNRILLGHATTVSIYNSTMALKKNDLVGAQVTDVVISPHGDVSATGMNDGSVKFFYFYSASSTVGSNWTYDFGAGNAYLSMSHDGCAITVRTADTICMYSIAGAEMLWTSPVGRAPDAICVSGDGNYAVICYSHMDELVVRDRAGKEMRRLSVSEARGVVVDVTGDTIAVLGTYLDVFRPRLDVNVESTSWTVSSGITTGFGIEVTKDGAPISGASLTFQLVDNVASVAVSDQGNGRYWVTIVASEINDTRMVTWSATASLSGYSDGTASGTLTVLPADDPANYDSRLQGLSDQLDQTQADLDQARKDINGMQMLQLVTLVVAVILAMVIVFLMVRHSRPPETKL